MNKNKNNMLIVSLCIAAGVFGAYAAPHSHKKHSHSAPKSIIDNQASIKNTVYAFDLHNVVFSLSKKGVIRVLSGAPGKLKLLWLVASPSFWDHYHATKKLADSTESRILLLSQKYPELLRYKQTFFDLCNQQIINSDVVDIIKQLKNKDATLVVASNIGEFTYQDLTKKYPELNTLFDFAFTTGEISDYTKKPDPRFFKNLTRQVHKRFPQTKSIVFIDDKEKNTEAALYTGLNAILFESAQDLAQKLRI